MVDVNTVVLVEGVSDRRAVEALARRLSRDLHAERIAVVAMGGATNITKFLRYYGPTGRNLRVAGLYDAAEARFFRQGLERAGLFDEAEALSFRPGLERAGSDDDAEPRLVPRTRERTGPVEDAAARVMADLGFHRCVADLEDELIRALGITATEELLSRRGDLAAFRTLQQQPAQAGRSTDALLRRFMGTRGGRKIEYASLMINALPLGDVPPPLRRLLEGV